MVQPAGQRDLPLTPQKDKELPAQAADKLTKIAGEAVKARKHQKQQDPLSSNASKRITVESDVSVTGEETKDSSSCSSWSYMSTTASNTESTIGGAFSNFFTSKPKDALEAVEIKEDDKTTGPVAPVMAKVSQAAHVTLEGAAKVTKTIGVGISTFGKAAIEGTSAVTKAGVALAKSAASALFEQAKKACEAGATALSECFISMAGTWENITTKALEFIKRGLNEDTVVNALSIAAKRLLIKNDASYDSKIAALQEKLKQQTGSDSISKSAKALSDLSLSFIKHHVMQVDAIAQKNRPDFVKSLVKEKADGKTELTFIGKLAKNVISENEVVIHKCIELNITSLVSHVLTSLEELQKKNPHFLADTINYVCKQMSTDSTALRTPEEEKKLFNEIGQVLINKALPKGLDSLELPLISPVDQLLKGALASLMPSMISTTYIQIAHETTKEQMLLAITETIQDSLSSLQTPKKQVSDVSKKDEKQAPIQLPYDSQGSFNKNTAIAARQILEFIDKDLYQKIFKNLPIEKIFESVGPKITAKLGSINLAHCFSKGLQDITSNLSSQTLHWDKLKPTLDIMTNPTIRENMREEYHKRVDDNVESISINVKAMAKAIVEKKTSVYEKHALEELLSDSKTTKRNAKIRISFINLNKKIRTAFLELSLRALRVKSRIPLLCKLAVSKIRALNLGYVMGSTLQGALQASKNTSNKKP